MAEIANIMPDPHQPYAGRNAFAHKAGLHVSAIVRRPDAYEHVAPASVGNSNHIVVSDLAGRANLCARPRSSESSSPPDAVAGVLSSLKDLEARGYAFEAADASLELFLRRADRVAPGAVRRRDASGILVEEHEKTGALAEATVKARSDGERHIETAEGHGPVGALDNALRLAIGRTYPELEKMELTDYRVRVLDGTKGTGAVVRVLIEMTDGEREWTTVGVSREHHPGLVRGARRGLHVRAPAGRAHAEPCRAGALRWAGERDPQDHLHGTAVPGRDHPGRRGLRREGAWPLFVAWTPLLTVPWVLTRPE